MFGLFGKKKKADIREQEAPETGPVEDAKSILSAVDYYILRAAWDEYVTIKKEDPDYQYGDTTPAACWKALEKVTEYGGSFNRFTREEASLLQALRSGFMIYDDVMHVLIDHHDDQRAIDDLAQKYPDISTHLPQGIELRQVIDMMIEVVRDYQWQLEHFGMKFGAQIDAALDPARAHDIARQAVALPDAHQGSYAGEENRLTDAERGIVPKPSPMAQKLAASVLDRMEALEASLAQEKDAPATRGPSVLDQEELQVLLNNPGGETKPVRRQSVLDQEELAKLRDNS